MPEIAEVARIVHYLKKHAVGKVITSVTANVDEKVFDKTSSDDFAKIMKGKKVVDVKQLGKYFWMVMDKPPHPVMHFGMTGWMVFRQDPTSHYRAKPDDPKPDWPPKFDKFILSFDGGKAEDDIAFVDMRRLAKIRLVDCKADDIRNHSPLKENGPDPIVDDFKEGWFVELTKKRRVPVKSFLLDQHAISGVGNWVGDEILYHARIHPEQYCHTLTEEQLHVLYEKLMYVCRTAVGVLGDASKFPDDWLMNHRWQKGKSGYVMPSGEKIDFLKVGGRTSAYVKTRQKVTGGTALPDSKASMAIKAEDDEEEDEKPAKKKKKQAVTPKAGANKRKGVTKQEKAVVSGKKRVKEESEESSEESEDYEEEEEEESNFEEEKPAKKRKSAAPTSKKKATLVKKEETPRKAAAPRKRRLLVREGHLGFKSKI